jgi:hypothetical protein
MAPERLARAVAGLTGIRPELAAAAARAAQLPDRYVDWYRHAVECFTWREMELRRQMAAAIVFDRRRDKPFAHPLHCSVQRWKIDRHLIGEPHIAAGHRHGQHAPGGTSIITRANRVVPHHVRLMLASRASSDGAQRLSDVRQHDAIAEACTDRSCARNATDENEDPAGMDLSRMRLLRRSRRILIGDSARMWPKKGPFSGHRASTALLCGARLRTLRN